MLNRFLLGLIFAGSAITAWAAPITFNVNGTFDDGTAFSGNFVLDGAANALVSSDIITLPNGPFPGAEYTSSGTGSPSIQGNDAEVPGDFSIVLVGDSSDLFFWFSGTPDAFTGGDIEGYPASCGAGECGFAKELDFSSGFNIRLITSGSASIGSAPEPNTALLVMGFAGLTALLRKRLACR